MIIVKEEAKEIVKTFIEERGMKKNFFRKKCKICLQTLKRVLSGKNVAELTMVKIANYIGVDYDQLFKRTYNL